MFYLAFRVRVVVGYQLSTGPPMVLWWRNSMDASDTRKKSTLVACPKKKEMNEQQPLGNAPCCISNSNSMDFEDNNNNKKKTTREQGLEYSSTKILLVSKAWISASENTLVGVSQRMSTFWESVSQAYNAFKQQHKEYMQCQM
jgi:hypothetical protein